MRHTNKRPDFKNMICCCQHGVVSRGGFKYCAECHADTMIQWYFKDLLMTPRNLEHMEFAKRLAREINKVVNDLEK